MPLLLPESDAALPADEQLARRWDRCIANTATKTAAGTAVGIAISFLFLRRRGWPVAFSAGVGVGIAAEQCAREFNPHIGIAENIRIVRQ